MTHSSLGLVPNSRRRPRSKPAIKAWEDEGFQGIVPTINVCSRLLILDSLQAYIVLAERRSRAVEQFRVLSFAGSAIQFQWPVVIADSFSNQARGK